MQVLFSAGDRKASVSRDPASRCPRGQGYGIRWWGTEERSARQQDQDFRITQGACLQPLRRTWLTAAATLVAAKRWTRRHPSREGGSVVQSRGRR